jgi:hypothetical protein
VEKAESFFASTHMRWLIVKRLIGFLLLVLTGLLATACAAQTAPTAAPARAPEVLPAATPAAETAAAAGTRAQVADPALIGQTGRPQFLNSYAVW